MRTLLRITCFLAITSAGIAFSQADKAAKPLKTKQDVDLEIARLKDPKTRLAALERLVPFGEQRLYQTSVVSMIDDPAQEVLIQRAADAVRKYADVETIGLALESRSEYVQWWALNNYNVQPTDHAEQWLALVPRLRELATRATANLRGLAQDRLHWLDGEGEFLDRFIRTETCAENIIQWLNWSNGKDLHSRLNPHLLRLLDHKDSSVRCSALSFIGFDRGQGSPWHHIEFTDDIVNRTLELSHSADAKERASAVYALTELRHRLDDRAIRERLLELVGDPAEDVRWRVPLALNDHLGRADVQQALARLLEDKSASVRYYTISTLGFDKHVKELRELAAGEDKEWAQRAAAKLKSFEKAKTSSSP